MKKQLLSTRINFNQFHTWFVRCRNLIKASALISLMLFSFTEFKPDNSTAVVNKIDGYYIFIESKPVSDYEVQGTVETASIVWSGKPKEMMNIILRRVKRKFPKADGIIFEDHKLQKAQVITFK